MAKKVLTIEKLLLEKQSFVDGNISKDTFYQVCILFMVQNPEYSQNKLAIAVGIPKSTFKHNMRQSGYKVEMQKQFDDMDNQEQDEFMRLVRANQRQSDKMRIQNTKIRKTTRLTNALEEYTNDLLKVFKKHDLSKISIKHPSNGSQSYGILHLSDLHINEQIKLSNNEFNLEIASKRLQKHVDHAKKVFKGYGVSEVLVAFTGDLLNSDRRLDELLMNATNRANATFIAVDILQQVILDLNKDFNVRCANVTGNESRVGQDIGWVNDIGQDNFDFMIYNTLAYVFRGSTGVVFLPPDDTYLEKVVTVGKQNILLIHGHSGIAHNTESKFASKIGQYAQKGIFINYIIFGHLHSAMISDMYARSSGLPGANNYSQNALSLTGKASQNFYIVSDNGDIHGMKVDLQDTTGYDGYNYTPLDIYSGE